MSKAAKIKLLKGLQNGSIKLDKIDEYLNSSGLNGFETITWREVEPGFYRNDAGELYNPDKPQNENVFNIRIRYFHNDGTPCPPIARSEKEVFDRMKMEGDINE